jgi:predicted GIY-YIG superfamily endonuclease
MFTIYVYHLTSPHLPGKAYIGSSKDVAARFQQHKNQRRAAGALFDAGDVALEVLGEFEVETRCEQCRIEGRFQQESTLDLLNVRVAGRTARERYSTVERPRRGTDRNAAVSNGHYRQLKRYREKRNDILRQMCIKRARRLGKLPTTRSMEKYGIARAEIFD